MEWTDGVELSPCWAPLRVRLNGKLQWLPYTASIQYPPTYAREPTRTITVVRSLTSSECEQMNQSAATGKVLLECYDTIFTDHEIYV